MNVLLVHNHYQHPGGEDQVFNAEARLLEAHGHRVVRLVKHNDSVSEIGRLALVASTIWNKDTYKEIGEIVCREEISVVHFHNTLPLVSPAAYYAARNAGAVVVQTLHNYRMLCVAATLFRDGRLCDDCVGRNVAWPGVLRRCYRGSLAASTGVAAMLALHRLKGTWTRQVDCYIALTEFAKKKFIAGGIPEFLISVKPNFVAAPAPAHTGVRTRTGFLYVGRLALEKGVLTLMDAAARSSIPLSIVGGGPVSLQDYPPNIRVRGFQTPQYVTEMMQESLALVLPSRWYEGFPMVVAEAFANGLPVIASRIGGIPEIVEDGVTGLLFNPGDAEELAAKLAWAHANPERMAKMGDNARRMHAQKYSPSSNYRALISIYERITARGEARTASL